MSGEDPDGIPGAFARAMAAAPPGPLGLAVSGGGDSMALLALAADWAGAARPLAAATVDHGLRPEAAAEAAAVARACLGLAIPHATLRWDGRGARGNLAEAAREARRALLAGWARAQGLAAILLGHTEDDQAETFLLRLARGSGVGGLACMAPVSEALGVLWLRPLLGMRRAALRDLLRRRGWSWAEDPSNADPARDRARARALLDLLGDLGLTVPRLAMTARHMAEAREVLDAAEAALAGAALAWGPGGEARIATAPLRAAPRAVRLQFLADVLAATAGARHPPRLEAVEGLAARIEAGAEGGTSLAGCIARIGPGRILLRREPGRVAGPVPAAPGALWDGRWRLGTEGPVPEGAEIGALGRAAPARPPGIAAETLAATPAVRLGDRLLAAPVAGLPGGWEAQFVISDPRRRRLLGLR